MTPTERFTRMVTGPESDISLDEACLLIAAHAHPGLDVAEGLGLLDALATGVRTPDLDALRHHLFDLEGFRGNEGDYHDPENSYLDSVLRRRLGLPITLSVVLIEVGRRAGVELVGIGMPGHFLVGTAATPRVFIDAFAGGVLLDEAGCAQRFATMTGGQRLDPSALAPVGSRAILSRMLANLTGLAQRREHHALLQWVPQLRAVIPGLSPAERRDVAVTLAAAGRYDLAADMLEDLADALSLPAEHDLRRRAVLLRSRLN